MESIQALKKQPGILCKYFTLLVVFAKEFAGLATYNCIRALFFAIVKCTANITRLDGSYLQFAARPTMSITFINFLNFFPLHFYSPALAVNN